MHRGLLQQLRPCVAPASVGPSESGSLAHSPCGSIHSRGHMSTQPLPARTPAIWNAAPESLQQLFSEPSQASARTTSPAGDPLGENQLPDRRAPVTLSAKRHLHLADQCAVNRALANLVRSLGRLHVDIRALQSQFGSQLPAAYKVIKHMVTASDDTVASYSKYDRFAIHLRGLRFELLTVSVLCRTDSHSKYGAIVHRSGISSSVPSCERQSCAPFGPIQQRSKSSCRSWPLF